METLVPRPFSHVFLDAGYVHEAINHVWILLGATECWLPHLFIPKASDNTLQSNIRRFSSHRTTAGTIYRLAEFGPKSATSNAPSADAGNKRETYDAR